MFNYLMCKKCWKRIRAFQKQFRTPKWIWCVCLWAKSIEKKKVQKSRTQFYEIVSEGIFLFLCTCVFTRLFHLRFYYMTLQQKVSKTRSILTKKDWKENLGKNLSYFVKNSLVFVPFCQNWYMYIVFYPFHINVTAVR